MEAKGDSGRALIPIYLLLGGRRRRTCEGVK